MFWEVDIFPGSCIKQLIGLGNLVKRKKKKEKEITKTDD